MLVEATNMWDHQIIAKILSEYHERFVNSQRLDTYLSEMKASGLIEDIEHAVHSVKHPLLRTELSYRFRLTPLGVRRAELYRLAASFGES